MKRNCKDCVFEYTKVCSTIKDKPNCYMFTLKPDLVQKHKDEQLNETNKKKLYKYFFRSCINWLDNYNPHNRESGYIWYYSIDQQLFLKRSLRNPNDIGNWIPIKHDQYKYLWLRSKLGNDDPRKMITEKGRFINTDFVKDDIFIIFEEFVNETFNKFWNANKSKTKKIEAKELF